MAASGQSRSTGWLDLLLGDDAALDEAVASGQTQTLPLARPLPVYLLYWTAIAGEDGSVGFRPDRYGRDSLLLAKMDGNNRMDAGKAGQIKVGSLSSSGPAVSPSSP